MGPKGARKGLGQLAWSPWAAGLAHFGAQSVSVFFSAKYASTLICILPKPPTISAYKYPEAAVNREDVQRDRRERVGHKRKETPEASSSLGAAASWRTARDPSLAGDFTTMIDYASLSFMG